MGSSWRYHHVAIMLYSLEGFHGLVCTFFTGSLVLFMGLHFVSMDKPVNSFVGEKLWARIKVNRKTKISPICRSHLFKAFSNPVEPQLYPTRSHSLWNNSQITKDSELYTTEILMDGLWIPGENLYLIS